MPLNNMVPEKLKEPFCVKLLVPEPPLRVIFVPVIVPLFVILPAVVTLVTRPTVHPLESVKLPPAKVCATSTKPPEVVKSPEQVKV